MANLKITQATLDDLDQILPLIIKFKNELSDRFQKKQFKHFRTNQKSLDQIITNVTKLIQKTKNKFFLG